MFDFFQMQKKLLMIIAFLSGGLAYAQFECPILTSPILNATNVPVDITITWEPVAGVPSYLISLGTTPGGTDITNNQTVGAASYTPELGLPEDTDIYVTITLFFFNAENITCPSEMFRTEEVTTPPPCTTLFSPNDGMNDVSTMTPISWNRAPTATGYRVSMGTAERSRDLLDNFLIEDALSYEPNFQFPFETEIFVLIIPFNENGIPLQPCEEFSFTTQSEVVLPLCTSLSSPADGEVNVPLNPILEWNIVPEAEGYRVSIGTVATENNILDNGAYSINTTEVFDLLPNRTYYVTITPFNSAGDAIGCKQVSFTSILGCGPVADPITGETVTFKPMLNFPDSVALCLNENPTIITSDNDADGHRWYKVNSDSTETLVSETSEFSAFEEGQYRYEAYNLITQLGDTFECSDSKVFTVSSSEIATITSLDSTDINGVLQITVNATGIGNYEYAIDSSDGPYQDNKVFQNIAEGPHTIYVRDKNDCGIADRRIIPDLTLEGFPSFFSPNGDGVNDYWQFTPPLEAEEINVSTIHIFDRYGNFLKQIDPLALGWDGTINGRPMSSSVYWFTAVSLATRKKINGYFALKR